MSNILQTLEDLPIAKLSGHLEVAHGSAKFSADAVLDPENLLGELGHVLKNVKLPSNPAEITEAVTNTFGQLQGFAQLPDLAILGDIGAGLSDLVNVLESLAGHFGGDLTQFAEKLLSDSGSIEDVLKQAAEQMLQALPINQLKDLTGVLSAIHALVDRRLQQPEEVAEIFAQLVAGVSLDELNAPGAYLEDFLGHIRTAGGDFSLVDNAINGLTTRVRAATSVMLQGSVDVNAMVAEIGQISAEMDLLAGNTIPGALARLTTDLAALDPEPLFEKATAALQALLDKIPHLNFDLVDTIGETVGQMLMSIANTTEADLQQKFQDLAKRLHDDFALSGVADATSDIDAMFDYVVGLIEEIPLRRLRHQLIDFLAEIEAKIRSLGGFSVLSSMRDEAAKISAAIDHFDTNAVKQKVQGIVQQLNDLIGKFPINEIKQEAEGLVGAVSGIVQQLQPLFDQVDHELVGLAQQVAKIDLSAAGQQAIGLMHEIRTTVEKAAGSGDLPEPAKVAISTGAGALKTLNLAVDITDPFNAALNQVDPSLILAPVRPVLGKVQITLQKVTPASLIAELDGPFGQLQMELDRLKPANLLAAVTGDVGRFMDTIAKGDPQALVAPLIAPLQAEFQKLTDAVKHALDPAPLFAPLHEAYKRLEDLLKQLDIGKLLGALMERLSDVPGGMNDAVKGALSSRGFSPTSNLPQATMGDLKMGDFLRPITHFLGQLRLQIIRLAHDLLQKAWDLLRKPLQALDELAQPAIGFVGKIAQEVDGRLAALDLFSPTGAAAELRQAIEDLITAHLSIQGDATVDASLGPAVAHLDVGLRMNLVGAPRQTAEVQRQRFHQAATPLDLYSSAQKVGEFYAAMFPASLRGNASVDNIMSLINGLLDKFDLTPLADKLDEIGEQAVAKLKSLFTTIMKGVFELLDAGFGLLDEFMPAGIFDRFNKGIARVVATFNVLDPTPIEAEVRALVDALVSVFDQFSPSHLAEMLSAIFESLRTKLNIINPAVLLGDLSAIDNILAQFGQLKPSIVLAPLVQSTAGLNDMLQRVSSPNVGDVVIKAVARLKAQLEDIVAGLQQELQALLDYLESLAGGGGASVSVSASVG
jgi:hypothetical protein